MDSLRAYLVGGLPADLQDPSRLTAQARDVRSLLLDENMDDRARVEAILDRLRRDDRLAPDTLAWLKRVLRGHYGIEYAAANLTEDEQLRFWGSLANHFRGDTALGVIHADALLLAGELSRALDAFNGCFEADPAMIWGVGGEVPDMMAAEGGWQWFRYRLSLLRRAVLDGDEELSDELDAELREEREGHEDALAAIARARSRPGTGG